MKMVSKRRILNEDEPGPSKKRCSPDKSADESPDLSVKKKKSKKSTKDVQNKSESVVEDQQTGDSSQEETNELKTKKKASTVTNELPNWPMNHMSELFRRMENALPQKDSLIFRSRAERLNWNEIAFESYTGAQCRIMWDAIQKRLRRFRILRELLEDAKSWILKPWTNFYRSIKTNRHPDMPRRPLSTYMLFYMKKKDKVLMQNPGLEMTGLSKHIADMYKKISPKTKAKYDALAVVHRKEFEVKLKDFYRLHPELQPANQKNRSLSQVNDPLLKKPLTPFKMFCEDKLKRHQDDPGFDKMEFLEKCKEQWKNMSDKKKVFWINWALERESKYLENMKKYCSENPEFVPSVSKSILTKEERTLRERMAGKPEKPPYSAYSLYSRLMLTSEDVKTVSPKDRMFVIAQQWKNCPEVEKKGYNEKVRHMLEQYKLQYAEYLESLPEDKRQEELQNSQPKKKTKSVKPGKTSTNTENAQRKPAKKTKKNTGIPKKNISSKSEIEKANTVQANQLFEGEPEQPPATPYLLFIKTYEANKSNRQDAHDVWEQMDNDERNVHRRILHELKRVYIESYENFLKGLTQEELKEYSEWKKKAKQSNDSDDTSDNSTEESDDDAEEED